MPCWLRLCLVLGCGGALGPHCLLAVTPLFPEKTAHPGPLGSWRPSCTACQCLLPPPFPRVPVLRSPPSLPAGCVPSAGVGSAAQERAKKERDAYESKQKPAKASDEDEEVGPACCSHSLSPLSVDQDLPRSCLWLLSLARCWPGICLKQDRRFACWLSLVFSLRPLVFSLQL